MFRRSGLRTVASRLNSTRPSRGGPHPDGRSTAERLLFGLEPQERYGPYIPLKWFMLNKGYGFLEPEDGSADVSCHLSAVRASSRDTLPEGAAVTCEVVQGDRGPQGVEHSLGRIPVRRTRPGGPRPALRHVASGPRKAPFPRQRTWRCRGRSSSTSRHGGSVSSCPTAAAPRCPSMPACCFTPA